MVLMVLCLLATSAAAGVNTRQSYQVEGHYRYVPVRPLPPGVPERVYSFVLERDGPRWLIVVDRGYETTSPGGFSRYTAGCDGQDIYIALFSRPEDLSPSPDIATNSETWRAELEQARRGLTPQWGEVWAGPVPRWMFWDVHLLWLAFCGGDFFRSNQPSPIDARFFIRNPYEPDEAVQIYWAHNPRQTDLLMSLVWMHPGHASRGPNLPRFVFPPPFDKGFTNMVYEVVDLWRFDGRMIPRKFRYTWFSPAMDPRTGRIQVGSILEGEVEQVTELKRRITGRPALGALYQVTDHRAASMNDGKPLVYRTHREWWQTNEARFVKALQGIFEEEKPAQLSRWTVWAAFGLLVVLYGVGYWVWRLRRQSRAGSVPGGG
ncbi:hypothetical protein [Limisphaera sp. 4302-co]|uniref:hypothetical protein n=1 Tax=Limisphaera sp. 4302-co TaxID=3400417 RepID=UPI003C22465B